MCTTSNINLTAGSFVYIHVTLLASNGQITLCSLALKLHLKSWFLSISNTSNTWPTIPINHYLPSWEWESKINPFQSILTNSTFKRASLVPFLWLSCLSKLLWTKVSAKFHIWECKCKCKQRHADMSISVRLQSGQSLNSALSGDSGSFSSFPKHKDTGTGVTTNHCTLSHLHKNTELRCFSSRPSSGRAWVHKVEA